MINDIKVTGRIVLALPEKTGVSKSGTQWRRQEFVLDYSEPGDNFPRKLSFVLFGGSIDRVGPLQVGDRGVAHLDISAREWEGKFFNDVSCWKFERASDSPQPQPQTEGGDDLPW